MQAFLACFFVIYAAFCLTSCKTTAKDSDSTKWAILSLSKVDATSYPFDKMKILLQATDMGGPIYAKEYAAIDQQKTVDLKVLAGNYQLLLQYLKGDQVVLSNSLCKDKTETVSLEPIATKAINTMSLNLCKADQTLVVLPPANPADPKVEGQTPAKIKESDQYFAGIEMTENTGGADAMTALFANAAKTKAQVLRLALHLEGKTALQFDDNQNVSGPGASLLSDLKQILTLAADAKIKLIITLWPAQMLHDEMGGDLISRNRKLLTSPDALKAFIDKALIPIVDTVSKNAGFHSFEICHEGETMASDGVGIPGIASANLVTMKEIQLFVGTIAAAIHKAAPAIKLTTGMNALTLAAEQTAGHPFYADSVLSKATAGDALAKLDYLLINVNSNAQGGYNPFSTPALIDNYKDKPLVIGSLSILSYPSYGLDTPHKLYTRLKELGYAGGLISDLDISTPALQLTAIAVNYLKDPASFTAQSPDSCTKFNGGYGAPFFTTADALYRKKNTNWSSNGTDQAQWCVVE